MDFQYVTSDPFDSVPQELRETVLSTLRTAMTEGRLDDARRILFGADGALDTRTMRYEVAAAIAFGMADKYPSDPPTRESFAEHCVVTGNVDLLLEAAAAIQHRVLKAPDRRLPPDVAARHDKRAWFHALCSREHVYFPANMRTYRPADIAFRVQNSPQMRQASDVIALVLEHDSLNPTIIAAEASGEEPAWLAAGRARQREWWMSAVVDAASPASHLLSAPVAPLRRHRGV